MHSLIERRASIEALARAVAQSPDGVAVLAWGGEILYANPAWIEMHGYSLQESIGSRIQDLYPGEELERHAAETVSRLSEQDSYEIEIRHHKKDGTPFQAWLITTLLRDESGKPNGFVITARDVTEWNRLRVALENEKTRLEYQYRRQEALASIELAINEPDELQTTLERIVQIATDLLPASGGASILLWNQATETYTISASTVEGQPPSLAARRIRRQGGATRWILDNSQPVVVENTEQDPFSANSILKEFRLQAYAGVPVLAAGTCLGVLYAMEREPRHYHPNDIDFLATLAARAGTAISKVQLYEQLRETNLLLHKQAADLAGRNADLDAFAHSVAHDLKNPLTSIMGYTELLLDDYDLLSNEERLEFLGHIARRSTKMHQIVDGLLLMSQLHSREVQLTAVDMQAIVTEACNRLHESRQQRDAILHMPHEWPLALGYPQWLEEVWANYVSNAIKYGGTPPEIWLGATHCGDDFIRFWVKDNGAGLTPEQQTQLFLPFTRLHTSKQEGHGLGLSIVRRIVEKCRGTVGVESEPGVGSIFWFTLPRAEE
ncbi:MAG: ATP-binding protein [Caldilineaceae bacterium]